MRIKNSYFIEKSNNTCLIQPIKKEITLNEIGLFLWENIKEKDLSSSELLNLLLEKFEISTVLALGEIDSFIKTMKEYGILE